MTVTGMQALRNAVVGVFVLSLLLGIFLPVYTDEIGWRFQERAAIDGVDKLYSDICGPNTLAAPPAFMMPARYYSAVFNTAFATPLTIRLSGILYPLVWTAMLLVLIRRIAVDAWHRSLATVCGVGLMCIGTLPLLLVWSRPEQPVLIALFAALLIAWSDWRSPAACTAAKAAWLRSAAIVALAAIALSYHLKGVFLLPVFLACLVFASRGPAALLPRLVTGAVLVGLTAWAVQYWVNRMQCPGDAIFWARLSRSSFGASLTQIREWSQIPGAVAQLWENVRPAKYAGLPAPSERPMSYWLAAGQLPREDSLAWDRLIVGTWALAALAAIAVMIGALARGFKQRMLDRRIAMALILLATALGWSALQLVRHVYEASFVLPVFMLAIVFALAARGDGRPNWPLRIVAGLIGAFAVASPVAVAGIYGPSLIRAAQAPGYVAAQRYSVSTRPDGDLTRKVLATARMCRIPEPARANSVMIDDLTYLVYMRSRLPQHWLGVTGPWKGEITDSIAYLKSRGSDGIVVGCRYLPVDMIGRAKRNGAFCCLGPPNW